MQSRNNKPGIVKIKLPTRDEKIKALRLKRNLMDNGYNGVYLRSSMSHTDRVAQPNLVSILRELPNGNKYHVTGNGKVILKDVAPVMGAWTRGPPVNNTDNSN